MIFATLRQTTVVTALAIGVALSGCGSSADKAQQASGGAPVIPPQPAPVPDPAAGAYDWENPNPAADEKQDFYPVRASDITSTRTLDQTTKWLRWAIMQYGDAPAPLQRSTNVTINGCSMQWTQRADIEPTRFHDLTTAINLKDVNLSYGDIMLSANTITLQELRPPQGTLTERFYLRTNGTVAPDGDRTSTEGILYIMLAHRDRSEVRIAWALVHAASLCGATQ